MCDYDDRYDREQQRLDQYNSWYANLSVERDEDWYDNDSRCRFDEEEEDEEEDE